jgi:hypothetical protein
MKSYFIYLLLAIKLCLTTIDSTAQSNCFIGANQFVELINSTRDRAEEILLPCYSVMGLDEYEIDGQKSDYMGYRREYSPTNDEYFFVDVIRVGKSKKEVVFETANTSAYTKYKNSLKSFGFKFISESEKQSIYKKGNVKMIVTLNEENVGNTTRMMYMIRLVKIN